jgi:formate C-acetyltransferase
MEMKALDEFWKDGLNIWDKEGVENEPLIVRQALAFALVLEKLPVRIWEGDVIVGYVPPSEPGARRAFPDYTTTTEKELAAAKHQRPGMYWGHFVPDYAKVLQRGFAGIREDVACRMVKLNDTNDLNGRKRAFLRAVIICYDATIAFVARYRDLALQKVMTEPDATRRSELREIAAGLSRLSERPATTFREAIQLFWFVYLILQATSTNHPIGRFDQYMYPYLKAEIETGRLSLTEAAELVQLLFLKFNERSKLLPLIDPIRYAGGEPPTTGIYWGEIPTMGERGNPAKYNHWLQNIVVGGQNAVGEDASNELTIICLDAAQHFALTAPIVNLRAGSFTSLAVLTKAAKVILSGGGMPPIFNDDAFVPALTALGLPVEIAREYTNDGCWEAQIPGKTEYRYSPVHALQSLELTLNRGVGLLSGVREGIDTGDPLLFADFEDLYSAFRKQLQFQVHCCIKGVVESYGDLYEIAPTPFVSSLIDGCLEKARDVTEGGATYVFHSPILTGVPNAADSLTAMKKLVYEERTITIGDLLTALRAGFVGYEPLRQLLLRVPKFGNDNDCVDLIARCILEDLADLTNEEVRGHPPLNCPQMLFPPASGTFEYYRIFGDWTGASPDGRLSREAIATDVSPVPGMDREGPLAAIRSFSKLNFLRLPSGAELDLSLQRRSVEGPDGLSRLIALLRSFLEMGGEILTISINSVEQLREAQREPHKWPHLRVRVGGWSAYFVCLDKGHQEHHIARYEHGPS